MKIARIAPLTYTPGKLEYFSLIRSGIGADYHQGPVFHVFPGGDVMMIWGAYDYQECSNNLVLLYAVSSDAGLTWTDPQVYLADYAGGIPYWLQFLRLRGTDRVLLLMRKMLHQDLTVDARTRACTGGVDYFKFQTRHILRWSEDGGRTFDHGTEFPWRPITGGKELPNVGFYGSVECLIQLESGRILAGFAYLDADRCRTTAGWSGQHNSVAFMRSDDGGATWQRSNELVSETQRGLMEPTVAETAPGRLLCLMRTKAGCLYESRSEDGGATWSEPKPGAIPAPESVAHLLKLHSGNLLLAWNNVSSTTQHPRHPLVAALSRDGGVTWSKPKSLADETGLNQVSNHGLVQLDDGRILAGISHYHATRPKGSDLDMALFDEAWLSAE